MKETRKYAGSYRNIATRWGELVTGDHIVSTHDNMLGMSGSNDVMVLMDAFSGLQAVDSTLMAIKLFKGEREISRFYSDRSGEIERALRLLHIPSDTSQPGVPQNNVVAERLLQDTLEWTRTSLLRA
ncbi:MAG: hypothetical protein ACKPKO_34925, partial [Candidatus Fonsibacter sp.]